MKDRVVGLDLSLTSTGMSDGIRHAAVQTAPGEVLEGRLDRLVRQVVSFCLAGQEPALAVIEAPAWSRSGQPGHDELSALRLMVRHRLWRLDIPFAMVPPTALKRYTTGSGSASKQEMILALEDRFAGLDFSGVLVREGRYDQADAMGLAAMGYHHIGQPLVCTPGSVPPEAESLSAVSWPDLLQD